MLNARKTQEATLLLQNTMGMAGALVFDEFGIPKKWPSAIYVDHNTHARLCQESDGSTIIAKIKNGSCHLNYLFYRDVQVPIYLVRDDKLHMAFLP